VQLWVGSINEVMNVKSSMDGDKNGTMVTKQMTYTKLDVAKPHLAF